MKLQEEPMRLSKTIGKREFIQHTSKYIKWVEESGNELVITHQNRPDLILAKFKPKTLKDLRGSVEIKVHGDINEHILPGYEEW
jgi:antitoxin (DNA-binding transcriptional repressor) of toxin-antitoxin stability system